MARKKSRYERIKEKLEMYDMIIANLIAGTSIIEPDIQLDKSHISIGFSNIASNETLSKYYMIKGYSDWIQANFMDNVRSKCLLPGVRINFYMYMTPHEINWDSAEMRNKLSIWKKYTKDNSGNVSAFDYRSKRDTVLAKERIVMSTKYLNEADLDYKRSLCKMTMVVELTCRRDDNSLLNMSRSITAFKAYCKRDDIKVGELRINMIDWLQTTGIFCLRRIKEVSDKWTRKVVTDDILANFNSYKQGRIGETGVPLGIDVDSKVIALRKFKADPDAAENWLITAETGGGKSMYVKVLLSWLLADGFVITILDYEGDEYNNLGAYIKSGNPDDVNIISMGKGSTVYFDPMEIAELTGDEDIDCDLKETAMDYTLAIFRIIVAGVDGTLTKWEEGVVSTAIRRVYDEYGVTDDRDTWIQSKGLRVAMVYEEIVLMVERKEFIDETMDNIKHKAAVDIVESCIPYFEEGEAKSGTFKHPMAVNELFKSNFNIFSFGVKGATNSQIDPVILALKQLSVANVTIQISNHCKYVRHCFNVKVWEEYQRWGEAKGSAEIIGNAMTGGRKRGDVNFIITNDLDAILDESNPINSRIRQNLTCYAVGKIDDTEVRRKFCEKFGLMELEKPLELIAKSSNSDDGKGRKVASASNKYQNAFCIVLDNGKKAIVKARLPKSILKSKLFRTGVDVGEADNEDDSSLLFG